MSILRVHSSLPAILTVALLFSTSAGNCSDKPLPCGAKMPFVSFEAEGASTNGRVISLDRLPDPNEATPEIEASGRSYVELADVGQYCEFTATERGNALVIRHSIPDAVDGGGTSVTLSLYVNGQFARKLTFTSRYNWLYGDAASPHGGQFNSPQCGRPHVFWNDERFLLERNAWQAGDKLRLQKDTDDAAEFYGLDLVDLEQAAPALSPPDAPYLSVVEFGATGDDGSNDTEAIVRCIAAAKEQGAIVWFPAGRFHHRQMLALDGVQVQGAGVWHTELIGTAPQLGFILMGEGPRVADLFIESTAHQTRSDPGGMSVRSRGAEQWSMERVWITHTHGGMWLSHVSQGSIRGCRIYCTYADAINLNRSSCNNLVEQNYIRGAGDDGIATLAERQDSRPSTDNTFRRNTVVASWWGHNIDVAGGYGHVVEDNFLADNSHSGCFAINHPAAYPMVPLTGATIRRNTIVRGGGNHAGQRRGAVWSFAGDAAITGVVFSENRILNPIFCGLHLHGHARQEIEFTDNIIDRPRGDAMRIDETVNGKMALRDNKINHLPPSGCILDNAAGARFEVVEADSHAE